MTSCLSRRLAPAAALILTSLVAGCANVHSVEVGSVPDDYRTRHPIVVSEADQNLDIPIVRTEGRLSTATRKRIADFANRFRGSGSDALRVELPYGSANAAAAEHVSSQVLEVLRGEGVPSSAVYLTSYHAAGLEGPVPIRLAFSTLVARTERCGRFPEDLGSTHENKNYFNFGCASQQNLAAQVADPRDLLGPRGVDPIDATRRSDVIDRYRSGSMTSSIYRPSDVNYSW
ncbi:CpaD family pilus assembly protein [Antarcticirhabdus aurantiaca]|uniref:CpaD family pilus assembly lipoprotein n=1 Tax=Antarcticirhabdus aurantiaca TaxID=2606717 RepID=A0ACD4NTN5_9HYPH|nr:CpaD family pilus assembly lipoprotein [Antarcticirhabdus aurantiaca]WAJ30129.1 CpaD family pilus assembly lipoprotein [Jeongeuplla avenae]